MGGAGKVLAIVQARMGSERLPGKVLTPLAGRMLVDWHLDRLSQATRIEKVVVATTTSPADDPLVDHLRARGTEFFRGDEQNVLKRFADCAATTSCTLITRTTADCPLIDPALFDALVENFLNRDPNCHHSYISLAHSPRGFDTEIFTHKALQMANKEATDQFEREHVTPFLYQRPDRFNPLAFVPPIDASQFRLCVDEPRDLKALEALSDAYTGTLVSASAQEIVALLEANPQIAQINNQVMQRS